MAFPFFTGFYSKDFLLDLLYLPINFSISCAYLLALAAAFLTSLYSIKVLLLAFFNIAPTKIDTNTAPTKIDTNTAPTKIHTAPTKIHNTPTNTASSKINNIATTKTNTVQDHWDSMSFVLIFLSSFALFFGYYAQEIYLAPGSLLFPFFIHPDHVLDLNWNQIHYYALLPFLF
jgi:NADH:ubiquinone oxidoreductase subunit 5 (subunit L)/multisubunit Na+/H+ antiporter MnhA subunit